MEQQFSVDTPVRKSPAAPRQLLLDGLRFVAAISVVFYHYCFRGHASDNLSPVAYPALAPLAKYDYLGVELFFIISGYVLAMSLRRHSPRSFIISRICRLYPGYWVAVTVLFLVLRTVTSVMGSPPLVQYVVNMTMGQNFLGFADLDGVYWTLTYELKFYGLLLAVLVLGGRRHLPWLVAGWLTLAFAWLLVGDLPHILMTVLVPDYASFFGAGILFALLAEPDRTRWPLWLGLAFSYVLCLGAGWHEAGVKEAFMNLPHSRTIILSTITAIFVLFWVATRPRQRPWPPQLATVLTLMGALTYPLYLLHQNLGYVVLQRLGPGSPPYALLVGLLGLMLVATYALHRWVERPLAPLLGQWLGRYLPGQARAGAARRGD